MSSQQKRGFRLPWAAERSTEDGAAAATLEADPAEPTTPAQIVDEVGGELGEGPFHFADSATPDASTDASPEAPEVPLNTAEAAMIETETATNATLETAPAEHDGWVAEESTTTETPTPSEQDAPAPGSTRKAAADQAAAPVARASTKIESATRTSRTNPLVAGLVKAMREAALASREESTGRLNGDATAQTELLREAGTTRAAELRKRADEDIAGIRDWSKSEIARIKQETDTRIEARRSELEEQTQQHEANVERQVERVKNTVAAYELEMDRFFEKLLAENDPAKVAALAEQAPDAPDLAAELDADEAPVAEADVADAVPVIAVDSISDDTETPAGSEWDDVAWGALDPARLAEIADPNPDIPEVAAEATEETSEATAEATDQTPEGTAEASEAAAEATDEAVSEATDEPAAEALAEPTADATAEPVEGLEAEAAAEAEAASTEGLEIPTNDVWPTSVLAAARRTLHSQSTDFEAAGIANTRLFVNGLTSVAGISAFKGALGQLSGVRSVSVSSGQPGVFIFTVVHSPDTDLQDGIAGLTEFEARVTEATGGELTVVAQEPAA